MAISFWDDALKKKAEIIAAWKIKQSFQTAQYPCKETAFDWQKVHTTFYPQKWRPPIFNPVTDVMIHVSSVAPVGLRACSRTS